MMASLLAMMVIYSLEVEMGFSSASTVIAMHNLYALQDQ